MKCRPLRLCPSVAAAAGLLACTGALAIHKCTDRTGRVTFQDAPCSTEVKSEPVTLAPPNLISATPAAPPAPAAPATPPVPPGTGLSGIHAAPSAQEVARMADLCLDWYLPLLRDPRSAYHRQAAYAGTVLSMNLFATNGLGGYTARAAACEIKGGTLDDGWTRSHARRLGWKP